MFTCSAETSATTTNINHPTICEVKHFLKSLCKNRTSLPYMVAKDKELTLATLEYINNTNV